jgi:hypothetical protein
VAAAACSTVADDADSATSAFTHVSGQRFLTAYWTGDRPRVEDYAGGTFQDPYPEDLRSPGRLPDWFAKYMPPSEAVVHSLYRTTRELGHGIVHREGLWRDLKCTKRFVRGGPGGCIVTNVDFPATPDSPLGSAGSVAMNITKDGFVHFAVYQGDNFLAASRYLSTPDAQLDSEGVKYAPHVCVNCHGGKISADQNLLQQPDLGSIFRELEPSVLEEGPDVTRAQAEADWYALNQAILAANATLRSESEGALDGVDHRKSAVADRINAIYDGLGDPGAHGNAPFSHPLDDAAQLPPSWRAQDADSQALWTALVNPYCMQCHRHNDRDFSDYGNFAGLRSMVAGDSLLRKYVVDDGRLDTIGGPQVRPYMPQSERMFEALQRDPKAWTAINRWSRVPLSEATLEVTGVLELSRNDFTVNRPGPLTIHVRNRTSSVVSLLEIGGDLDTSRRSVAPNGELAISLSPPVKGTQTASFFVINEDGTIRRLVKILRPAGE